MKPLPQPYLFSWVLVFLLLAVAISNPVSGQPAVPGMQELASDVRARLVEAVGDPPLAPWHRGFTPCLAGKGETALPVATVTPPTLHPGRASGVTDGSWMQLTPGGTPPSDRNRHTAIYDPVRDRMVVYGGYVTGDPNEVWALSLSGHPAWSLLVPAGTPPPPRAAHTAIYDPVRDRMVVFGGWDGVSNFRNDAWILSFSGSPVWSPLAPAGSPPAARAWHKAVYDPVRDRMVVFGGYDGNSFRNDVWVLSFSGSPAWSALIPAGSPPTGRYEPSLVYDARRDRMVMFGGQDGFDSYCNDTWELSFSGSPAWIALAPAGSPPSARAEHTAISDPLRDRMVVFAGYNGSSLLNDVWVLSILGPAWSALTPAGGPPTARNGHTAIYDPMRDRMVVFGGYDGQNRSDSWALWMSDISTGVGDAETRSLVSGLGFPLPSPTAGPTTVSYSLATAGGVHLCVYDVRGRLVRTLVDGEQPVGTETVIWDGGTCQRF